MRAALDLLGQRRHQARLADTRLSRQQNEPAVPSGRLPPAAAQQFALFLASHQRRRTAVLPRLETAFRSACPQHLRGLQRLVEGFEHQRFEIDVPEQPANQTPRAGRDDHLARSRRPLQRLGDARGIAEQVDRATRHAALGGAGDDHAGRETDANLRQQPGADRELRQFCSERQRCLHRTFGAVLMRSGIAKRRDQLVPEMVHHHATEAADHIAATTAAGGDRGLQIFGVEPSRLRT